MAQPLVEFESNSPVEVALHYAEGRIIPGRYGQRVMYSLDVPAAHVMFLDLAVSRKINMLGPAAGERIVICKRGAGKLAEWDVWLSTEAEKARAAREAKIKVKENGRPDWGAIPETELEAEIRRKKETGAGVRASAPASAVSSQPNHTNSTGNGSASAAPAHNIHQGWAQLLLSQTNALSDVYAAALEHAKAHKSVKPEDVRALMVEAFINLSEGRGKRGEAESA